MDFFHSRHFLFKETAFLYNFIWTVIIWVLVLSCWSNTIVKLRYFFVTDVVNQNNIALVYSHTELYMALWEYIDR